jgi:hypothetical protein
LENKVFSWSLVALLLSVPFSTGVLEQGVGADAVNGMFAGYWELASTTKIASVSTMDLAVLTLVAGSLIPRDYRMRIAPAADDEEASNDATIIAAATCLLPVLGVALYCALRPPLPEE